MGRVGLKRAAGAAVVMGAAVVFATPPDLGLAAPAVSARSLNLTRNPSLSTTSVAFLSGQDVWVAPRSGGDAVRLPTGGRVRGGPFFSPDGKQIAYTAESGDAYNAEYGVTTDIFVISAAGGAPRRITWRPDAEVLAGWTPDGRIVFSSSRESTLANAPKLFTVGADGAGLPRALPLPTGVEASLSPDGRRIAYTPLVIRNWKGYRGGRASYIWVVNLDTLDLARVPHGDAQDWNPVWYEDKIYFLSDRDGPVSLYAYDPRIGTVRRALENTGRFDFKSVQAGPGGIVIDAFDSLQLFDPATGRTRTLTVRLKGNAAPPARRVELPGVRATARALSPDGSAYAVEARGEILIVPTAAGEPARNITDSPAVADRSPSWTPDGKSVAYLSDASGEYHLVVRAADGPGKPRTYELGVGRGLFAGFTWSPDGQRVAYVDERGALWILDLSSGRSVRAAQDLFGMTLEIGGWSPDGRLLAFSGRNAARMNVVSVYDLSTGRIVPITDGFADAYGPAFDRSGKLWFLASSDRPMTSTGSMASNPMSFVSAPYVADVSDVARPVITRLEAPPRKYMALAAGAGGALYLTEDMPGDSQTIWRVEGGGQAVPILSGVQAFDLALDSAGAVVRRAGQQELVRFAELAPGGDPARARGKALTLPSLPMRVDPKAEWRQMFAEGWRLQRDLFYAPDYHGLDLAKVQARYAPFVAGLTARSDLAYVQREAFSELRISHLGVTEPPPADPGFGAPPLSLKAAGLLGADYNLEDGRYRFAKIYRGDLWRPEAVGPLARPGVEVREGDYLLAVDGKPVTAEDSLDRLLEGKIGQAVEITVSATPSDGAARTFRVTPTASEFVLRHSAWIAHNREVVTALSGGKVGYVYLIDTDWPGFNGFNSQYLPQVDKAGVVVDERNNAGGPIAEWVIERLTRLPLTQVWPPAGEFSHPFPTDQLNGPAAMIVNETAGSSGDVTPYMFRKAKGGPIIGKRTWGGSVGAGPAPPLLDGGTVNVPHYPISDPTGTWGELEGDGVTPDIVVDQEPKLVAAGRDPQLEAAVKAVLDQIAARPSAERRRPPSRTPANGGRNPPAGSPTR